MKKSLFLYLFVFTLIINIFTYMYFTGQQKHDVARIEKIQKQLGTARDSLHNAGTNSAYFSIETSEDAADYFADKGFMDTPALIQKIKDGVLEQNQNPNGNPLTDNEPIDGSKFLIEKVQVLNHKWIIADFSNGKLWGDVLIKYFVEDNGTVTYEVLQSALYPNTLRPASN